MSTVLPPPLAGELLLPPLGDELLLLLQPAAAKAIAARAAIAVVRLIIFIFLSLIGNSGCREASWLACFGLQPLRRPRDGRCDQVFVRRPNRAGRRFLSVSRVG